MGNFSKSFSRELGKNTGKWVSNKLFGDNWSTPHRLIIQRERLERKKSRDEARAYQQQLLRERRNEKDYEKAQKNRIKETEKKEKEERVESNSLEVNEHNNYLNILQSVHKDYSNPVDWEQLRNSENPEPVKTPDELKDYYLEFTNKQINQRIDELKASIKMSFAKNIIGNYYIQKYEWLYKAVKHPMTPLFLYSLVFYILFLSVSVGIVFALTFSLLFYIIRKGADDYFTTLMLTQSIADLEGKREVWFNEYMEEQKIAFNNYFEEWLKSSDLRDLASRIIEKDRNSFIEAIKIFKPFEDLRDYGSDITYTNTEKYFNVNLYVHSEDVIPKTTKRLLRKGMEIKEDPIPQSRFNEIYQDYVCSSILRIGKEIFALLPIEKVLVNAIGNVINTSTGKYQEQTIISVILDKQIIESLNFDLLDPSDSMTNFNHNMNFKKSEGFKSVQELF